MCYITANLINSLQVIIKIHAIIQKTLRFSIQIHLFIFFRYLIRYRLLEGYGAQSFGSKVFVISGKALP